MKKFVSIILFILIFTGLSLENCYASSNKTNVIPVAMATDNKYVMPTLVSISSALKNSNKNTFLKFYVLISGDLTKDNREKFQDISKAFKNCSIELIDMGEKYANNYQGVWGKAMYYRLMLPDLLKDEKKCIYLDSDTLVLKDLQEFYNLNIEGYYLAGAPDGFRERNYYAKVIGIKDMKNYVCSGVLLWNLEKCRQDNLTKKFNMFISHKVDKEKSCLFPDQDTINVVCYGKIYEMPFKFGAIVGFLHHKTYTEEPFISKILSEDNWLDAKENTVVLHFVGPKPWEYLEVPFSNLWNSYLVYLNSLINCLEQ